MFDRFTTQFFHQSHIIIRWTKSFVLFLMIFAVCGRANLAKRRVCVIGAGLTGLVSVKQLSLHPDEFEPVVFEKQSDVGGLWIYTESNTVDEHGLHVHSGLYKNLRLNLPKALEAFPDYPEFEGDDSNGTFVEHTQMLQYLRNYTEHYNLRQYIQLNTYVEKVSPLPGKRWLIETLDLNSNKKNKTQCDAVIIGNGVNIKEHIPKIPGIEGFSGRVIHSHIYRHPEEFANQTVVILGASFSGIDISIDINPFVRKIYLSHRHDRMTFELPSKVEQVQGVVAANGSELILSDGSEIKADVLLLCTGYEYDYPFLSESSGIVVEDGKYVRSVYKHLINIEYPTMAILHIPTPGQVFLCYPQVAYFIAVLQDRVTLPSRDDMLKEAALPPGLPKSKAHYLLLDVLPYYNELAVAAGVDPLPQWYITAALLVTQNVFTDPLHFREKELYFNDDGSVDFF